MMTLEQIDADLREWDHKLRVASDNMLELSGSMSYQRLMGEGHWPKVQLSGATADRAKPAIAGLHTLWVYYSLIHDTIRRARQAARVDFLAAAVAKPTQRDRTTASWVVHRTAGGGYAAGTTGPVGHRGSG